MKKIFLYFQLKKLWIFYYSFILIGLFGSLKVVVGLFGVDSDTSHSLVLWHGVNSYGFSWLKDWMFTPDNWIFSLFPFHFLGFSLFGPKAFFVVFCGWLIFVVSAFLSGAIAWQLKAKHSAFLIPLVLLFLGFYAHASGFVAYSTSHNITNLFGLAVLFLFVKWLDNQKNSELFLMFLLFVAGAISDPWMIAAYNLPIAIIGILLFLYPVVEVKRINFFKLFLVAATSILLVKTKIFGVLGFLPGVDFQLGSLELMEKNAVFLIKDLGGLINIFPFNKSNNLVFAFYSIAMVIGLFLVNFLKLAGGGFFARKNLFVFLSFIFISIGGISLAFVIGSVEVASHSARFLLNCLYLIILSLGVLIDLNWHRSSNFRKIFSFALVFSFITSGIATNFHMWSNSGFSLNTKEVSALIDFLRKNNLSYGYGPYWGSNANSVTVLSNDEVVIRPVVFNKVNGMMVVGNRLQSSRRWYSTQDAPLGQKDYFVFIKSDGEECPSVRICVNGLSVQFGNPVRTLQYGDATVLVWDHPLIGYQSSIMKVGLGQVIFFNELSDPIMGTGWANSEKWGAWSDGDSASILFTFSEVLSSDLELLIDGHAFLTNKHTLQEVDVLVNGFHVDTLKYDLKSNHGVRVVKIPKDRAIAKNGEILVEFNFKNPISPADLGLSQDRRSLGLGIFSLQFKTID